MPNSDFEYEHHERVCLIWEGSGPERLTWEEAEAAAKRQEREAESYRLLKERQMRLDNR